MRLLQVTNMISHHQLPLAKCLAHIVGPVDFKFAVTHLFSPERRNLGWSSEATESWILKPSENQKDRDEFFRLWCEADVVFCGDRLFGMMEKRLKLGKLTFYMSERWFKPPYGAWRLLSPAYVRMVMRFRRLASSEFFHYLPIGVHASTDIERIADIPGRKWLWGYFTALSEQHSYGGLPEEEFRVLWVGRMLSWKRVDTLIRAFAILREVFPKSVLTLVGHGPECNRLKSLASQLGIDENICFIPPKPVTQILTLMRQHHVYVLPSNAGEGWGAVVNEAMGEGCAVIASDSSGAACSIIKHNYNGLLFSCGDYQELSSLLRLLASDHNLREKLARSGRKHICKFWSPHVASERLLDVSRAILSKSALPIFQDGPMKMM